MTPLKPLRDQTIVITGASSGIGRATALAAADDGARVVLAARDEEALTALARMIEERGGRALSVPTDVSVEGQVQHLAEQAATTFGGIDTWVNNAGVSAYGEALQLTSDELRRVMEVNFYGEVFGARAAIPHLERSGGGALIFIGSALSDRAIPLQAAYCASKHAIKAYVEALRVELEHRESPVQVTLIKPSSMDTPLFDQALTRMGYKPRPISPVYAPEVTAEAILHCAQHRERDFVVGGGGKLLTTLEAFAGPVLDWYQKQTAYSGQRSPEPKPANAPSNLFRPLPGMGRVTGTFSGRRTSLYTTLRKHRWAVRGTALMAGAMLLTSAVRRLALR